MPAGITKDDTMFSVREMPWHRLGVVLDDYPESVDEALEKSGLTWAVKQGDIYVAKPVVTGDLRPELQEEKGAGIYVPALESMLAPAKDYRANIREDTGQILGIVSDDYRVVENREAFAWLNELLYGELQIETAGSLHSGRRVWVLAKVPDTIEVGGDPTALYVYCANSHDGSMAVTASSTRVRILCANTLGIALREADGRAAQRTYKFRHTGDMAEKLGEARRAMGIVLKWDEAFKKMGDELATQKISKGRFDRRVVEPLLGLGDPELGKRARKNREDSREIILGIFAGDGPDGDTSGNSPNTKWTALNAIGEYADWCRRYTKNTDQMHRSFEDENLKQRGLDLVVAA